MNRLFFVLLVVCICVRVYMSSLFFRCCFWLSHTASRISHPVGLHSFKIAAFFRSLKQLLQDLHPASRGRPSKPVSPLHRCSRLAELESQALGHLGQQLDVLLLAASVCRWSGEGRPSKEKRSRDVVTSWHRHRSWHKFVRPHLSCKADWDQITMWVGTLLLLLAVPASCTESQRTMEFDVKGF